MRDEMVNLFQVSEATDEKDLDLAIAVFREGMDMEYRGVPLFRGADADGPNCKDIINGIAFSMPSCLCLRHCNFSSLKLNLQTT